MKLNKLFLAILAVFIISIPLHSQTNKKMTDYLGIPGPVVFDKKTFSLSWSSHPSATYYKHEYLPGGESVDKFKSMIMLEFVSGYVNIKEAAGAKVEELRKMKESNPLINYESFDNPKTGEYMIDFLITANAPDGKVNIAERNVYRYKAISDGSGAKGLLLFGVSTRSYGIETTAFIASLKGNRKDLVSKVAQFVIPAIKLK